MRKAYLVRQNTRTHTPELQEPKAINKGVLVRADRPSLLLSSVTPFVGYLLAW